MNLRIVRHTLLFKKPARTSRNTMVSRDVFYVIMHDESGNHKGIGEAAPIDGLSVESMSEVEDVLLSASVWLDDPNLTQMYFTNFPSVRFAIETALFDLANGGTRTVFPVSPDSQIPINGLVWMNDKDTMLHDARTKIEDGYNVIKLKIGGILFDDELEILKALRSEFGAADLVIRLDANGAFGIHDAKSKLEKLAAFDIHSIEQPIPAGHWDEMAALVAVSPIPVALDEELIGCHDSSDKRKLVETIRPAYLILKPGLHGGFAGCDEWITLAEEAGAGWWATSALESNIGLNAIAQWVASKNVKIPQGLGTGVLFNNNITSPLNTAKGFFFWDQNTPWNLPGTLE